MWFRRHTHDFNTGEPRKAALERHRQKDRGELTSLVVHYVHPDRAMSVDEIWSEMHGDTTNFSKKDPPPSKEKVALALIRLCEIDFVKCYTM